MREDIDRVRERWIEALNEGSAEGFIGCVTEDAVWLPSRGEAVEGRQAIARWLEPLFEEFRYDFTVSDMRVRLVGAWAVEEADFRSVLDPRTGAGEALTHQGRYLLVWRRNPDGWLIDRYVDRTRSC